MTNTNEIITIRTLNETQWNTCVIAASLNDALLQFAANLDRHAHAAMYAIESVSDIDFRVRLVCADVMPKTLDELNRSLAALLVAVAECV